MVIKSAHSITECACYLDVPSRQANKSLRASAFSVDLANSTCVVGRAPAYADAYINGTVPDNEAGVYFVLGLPLGRINLAFSFAATKKTNTDPITSLTCQC
jgi:hypothetical protein